MQTAHCNYIRSTAWIRNLKGAFITRKIAHTDCVLECAAHSRCLLHIHIPPYMRRVRITIGFIIRFQYEKPRKNAIGYSMVASCLYVFEVRIPHILRTIRITHTYWSCALTKHISQTFRDCALQSYSYYVLDAQECAPNLRLKHAYIQRTARTLDAYTIYEFR